MRGGGCDGGVRPRRSSAADDALRPRPALPREARSRPALPTLRRGDGPTSLRRGDVDVRVPLRGERFFPLGRRRPRPARRLRRRPGRRRVARGGGGALRGGGAAFFFGGLFFLRAGSGSVVILSVGPHAHCVPRRSTHATRMRYSDSPVRHEISQPGDASS